MTTDSDTIAAIASASGHSGVGVIRVSGPKAKQIGKKLCKKDLPERTAVFSSFHNVSNQKLDSGLALCFAKPKSYTGEDVLEIHTHGNPHVMALLMESIIDLGARQARPGEFTERAFMNNKMDLLQAEAVADLINANSKSAVSSALASLQGQFSKKVLLVNSKLIEARAMIEGALDFPDEDFDPLEHFPVNDKIESLKTEIQTLLKSAQQGIKLREGKKLVIFGKPNVGKSSLMNYFAQEDVAIVTEIAGTTRDSLSKEIRLGGINVEVVDTAGLRETEDRVEQEGIQRTQKQIEAADILLLLLDVEDDIETELEKIAHYQKHILVVINKIDLSGVETKQQTTKDTMCVYVSVKQQQGLELIEQALEEMLGENNDAESPFMARNAHIQAFKKSLAEVETASQSIQHKQLELAAESLKVAQEQLEDILGKTTADDVLTEIFSRFCIGK